MKNKLFNKIISISLCVITIVLGLLFILQCIRLNNHFTKDLIGRVLFQILPVIILWAVVFIISLFVKDDEKKPAFRRHFYKKISNKVYLAINIFYSLIIITCAALTISYLCQDKHFTTEFTKSVLSFAYYLLPFAIIALVASIIRSLFKPVEKIELNKIARDKGFLIINIIRAVVLTAAVTFIVIGIVNNQTDSVLNKAIHICLECVGIG